jgi:hypothetical protein
MREMNCESATFHGLAKFNRMEVAGVADFTNARFNSGSHFHGAIFLDYASFEGAAFADKPHLEETRFNWEKNIVFPGLPPGWKKLQRGGTEPCGHFIPKR